MYAYDPQLSINWLKPIQSFLRCVPVTIMSIIWSCPLRTVLQEEERAAIEAHGLTLNSFDQSQLSSL